MRFRPSAKLARLLNLVRATARTPVYLVGGTLRDALLGRPTTDLDLAVEGSAKDLAQRLTRRLHGTLVILDDATRVYRVVLPPSSTHRPWTQMDIAQILGKDIREDLLRRDFTINAMAWPVNAAKTTSKFYPGKNELLDPRNGLGDLKRRTLRADRPEVFSEDPLRLLRAFRIAAQLGFRMEPATLRHIQSYRRMVLKPAGERIRCELLGMFSSSSSHAWLELMDRSGILTSLFPELEKSRRCAEIYYGKGGVLRHSLNTVERMDLLLEKMGAIFPDAAKRIEEHIKEQLGSWERAKPLLRLAALLHDIAKPATARKVKGRLRFFGHDLRGAQQAAKLLKNLRFANDEISSISGCIRYHLRPGNLAANPVISNKAAFRFFQEVGKNGVPLLLVCWADHASYLTASELRRILPVVDKDPHSFVSDRMRGEGVRKTLRHLQVVAYLLHSYFQRRDKVIPPKLLDGHAVMKALKIPPGPAVGRAIQLLREAQADGKIHSRTEALHFLLKLRINKNRP